MPRKQVLYDASCFVLCKTEIIMFLSWDLAPSLRLRTTPMSSTGCKARAPFQILRIWVSFWCPWARNKLPVTHVTDHNPAMTFLVLLLFFGAFDTLGFSFQTVWNVWRGCYSGSCERGAQFGEIWGGSGGFWNVLDHWEMGQTRCAEAWAWWSSYQKTQRCGCPSKGLLDGIHSLARMVFSLFDGFVCFERRASLGRWIPIVGLDLRLTHACVHSSSSSPQTTSG